MGSSPCSTVPGIAAGALSPLADPGTPAARLSQVMRERAMWLYLTGHRQGDLRRLAHVYSQTAASLYPTGTYTNPGFGPLILPATTNGIAYGTDVVFLPANDEAANNPL